MWMKTTVHQLMPFIPKCYEAAQAAQIESNVEAGRNPAENGTITLTKDEYMELTDGECVASGRTKSIAATVGDMIPDIPVNPLVSKLREALFHAPEAIAKQYEQVDLSELSDDDLTTAIKQIKQAIDEENQTSTK